MFKGQLYKLYNHYICLSVEYDLAILQLQV